MRILQKPNPPSGFRRTLWRLPIQLYHAGLGFLVGQRLMLLTHTGRISGQPRQTVLEVVGREQGDYLAASGFGTAADWFKNIRKAPEAVIQIGNRRLDAHATVLSSDEGAALMERYAMRHPKAARRLCKIMGFEVDGTAADFREVGRMIPFVRFTPAS
ncbi:nitroreductase family deazaflavin-dependent oxidoreductase [Mycobacterium sp. CBMA271]|uniref:nitroreductase family deazaflavin-dependent oxidoreductase n=1 Tax=unclassified Mycobacteroides TaxID=2618759 RepID=UPI0012DEC77B|nr:MULTISPECIES: nitroreductase family deazaflavin-dependent oxidoreductase [unclassified Mycobacteroides]MUM17809.1 nitroreductase [Mycobacteroides sp. CBMA 326]MUM20380.1 nitroreductase family deazaflavin-dependent oxidoreductase [Mycobacteroides sp. CBMA 271]